MTNSNDADCRVLADYLHRRLERLAQCNAEIESNLSDDKQDLCLQVDDGGITANDPAIGRVFFQIEYVFGNTIRYTMLVGVCSFLEEALKAIARLRVANYEAALAEQKHGNWLKKHIHLLSKSIVLDLSSIQGDLDKYAALIVLRNCVVHAWGKVSESQNPGRIEAAVLAIESAEITKDGYLFFGDQVVIEAIIAAENISDALLPVEV
jgi:hypothetical protein